MDAIKIENGIGGDTAEDVIGGLKVVLDPNKIKWLTDVYATKVRYVLLYFNLVSYTVASYV